ncbi:isocitrate lyase/phosphoenolpyruvate mutase family protein [Chryseolinea sp. T2]|uniref:isocitrate lyase/PEP mutase family protein n=1 Tax=Chryseolinea sp. T2 TaxID=3129255 RepID=UPI00307731C9
MKSTFEEFDALHQVKELFVLPNAWDARSAMILQDLGFKAIGTSSAAVASALGYDDGEQMSFEEYLMIIKRITASVKVPVTVDMEMGYGTTPSSIYANIQRLVGAGVAGINIEDSIITNSKRTLGSAEDFAKTIQHLKNSLQREGKSLFINVRSDTYLLKTANARDESSRRAKLYASAGADGLFLPVISQEDDIKAAVEASPLPLNVMCIPGLPDFTKLQSLGVRRASMGPFLQMKTYGRAKELASNVISEGSFKSIL